MTIDFFADDMKYLAVVLTHLVLLIPIFGDTKATECSYAIDLRANNLVFVMLASNSYNECVSQGKEKASIAKELRIKYKTSGLYEGVSSTPLWTVDWFSFRVFVSTDGKYLVRSGPWATDPSNEAFTFFADGKLLATYKVSDVVRYVSALPHSVSHFEWESKSELNDAEKTFEITTLENGKFRFNLLNGEMINRSLPIIPPAAALAEPLFYSSNWPIVTGVIIAFAFALFFVLRWLTRKRFEKE